MKPWSKPPSSTRFRRTGYEIAHRFPTAFEFRYGCVGKCQVEIVELLRWVRNQRLRMLRAANAAIRLFGDDEISVVVKSGDIIAQQDRAALAKSAEVEFRRGAFIKPADIAHRNRGQKAFRPHDYRLSAKENFAGMNLLVLALAIAAVNIRLGQHDELEPRQHGQLRDLIDADARAELGRRGRTERAGFELQIAYRRQRGRSRNGGSCGIGFGDRLRNRLRVRDTGQR